MSTLEKNMSTDTLTLSTFQTFCKPTQDIPNRNNKKSRFAVLKLNFDRTSWKDKEVYFSSFFFNVLSRIPPPTPPVEAKSSVHSFGPWRTNGGTRQPCVRGEPTVGWGWTLRQKCWTNSPVFSAGSPARCFPVAGGGWLLLPMQPRDAHVHGKSHSDPALKFAVTRHER